MKQERKSEFYTKRLESFFEGFLLAIIETPVEEEAEKKKEPTGPTSFQKDLLLPVSDCFYYGQAGMCGEECPVEECTAALGRMVAGE